MIVKLVPRVLKWYLSEWSKLWNVWWCWRIQWGSEHCCSCTFLRVMVLSPSLAECKVHWASPDWDIKKPWKKKQFVEKINPKFNDILKMKNKREKNLGLFSDRFSYSKNMQWQILLDNFLLLKIMVTNRVYMRILLFAYSKLTILPPFHTLYLNALTWYGIVEDVCIIYWFCIKIRHHCCTS